ncbi:MAG: hypothetical protein ACI8QF_002989, partial [Limisphaerales bacterium]
SSNSYYYYSSSYSKQETGNSKHFEDDGENDFGHFSERHIDVPHLAFAERAEAATGP